MADYMYGVTGQAVSDNVTIAVETLTSRLEYIGITTSVDIRSLADVGGSAASQGNLNKLIQIVSERGQPIIMGDVVAVTTPFSIRLVTEHNQGWGCVQGVTGVQLIDKIAADGINYGFAQAAYTATGYIGTVNGTGVANNVFTTTVASAPLTPGALITGANVSAGTYVTGVLTTGASNTGTYTVNNSQLSASASVASAAAVTTVTLSGILT